jgi:hypothetical protein
MNLNVFTMLQNSYHYCKLTTIWKMYWFVKICAATVSNEQCLLWVCFLLIVYELS